MHSGTYSVCQTQCTAVCCTHLAISNTVKYKKDVSAKEKTNNGRQENA